MSNLLPQTYLIGLIGLLSIVAILVGRQLLKVRRDEINLINLEKNDSANSDEAADLYELGSAQIRKRLYSQASGSLKKALKALKASDEPAEAKALIENALGFSMAAQDNFESAVLHYKNALKAKPDYPVALNNLAFAQQKLSNNEEAYNLYMKVLEIEVNNKTALKQIKKLKIVKGVKDSKGF